MDVNEFNRFSKHLFVAFPDVWEWLNANSPDVNATLDIWHKVLKGYALDECLHVVDDWITGKRPVFKAYERSQIAILIRQCAQFDRERERQRSATGNAANEFRKTRREDYKPITQVVPELGKLFREGLALRSQWLKGEISEEELAAGRKRLCEQA